MARRRKKRVLSNRGDRTGKPQAFLGTAALIAGGLKLAGGIGGGIWGAKKGKEAKEEYALKQEENANQMRQNSLQTSQMRDKLYSDALLESYNPQGDAQMYAKNGAAVMMKYGGLSREKDYGSSEKPYPKVQGKDFAGGNRSYPIPTKADAVDALRLAGLHGRSDVKAKVYDKYPGLKKKSLQIGGTVISPLMNMLSSYASNKYKEEPEEEKDHLNRELPGNKREYLKKSPFIRTYVDHMILGSTGTNDKGRPITEDSFTGSQIDAMHDVLNISLQNSKYKKNKNALSTNYIDIMQAQGLISEQEAVNMYKRGLDGANAHMFLEKTGALDVAKTPYGNVGSVLGLYGYSRDKDGNIYVIDEYDYNPANDLEMNEGSFARQMRDAKHYSKIPESAMPKNSLGKFAHYMAEDKPRRRPTTVLIGNAKDLGLSDSQLKNIPLKSKEYIEKRYNDFWEEEEEAEKESPVRGINKSKGIVSPKNDPYEYSYDESAGTYVTRKKGDDKWIRLEEGSGAYQAAKGIVGTNREEAKDDSSPSLWDKFTEWWNEEDEVKIPKIVSPESDPYEYSYDSSSQIYRTRKKGSNSWADIEKGSNAEKAISKLMQKKTGAVNGAAIIDNNKEMSKLYKAGGKMPYPYQDQPGTSINPTISIKGGKSLLDSITKEDVQKYFAGGGAMNQTMNAEKVPGGEVHQVTQKAQVVEGDNPALIDDVELGTNPGEPDIVADHNEVIVDAVDPQTGQPYKQIFSDSIPVPGENTTFAKKVQKYLKQMPEDESSPQAKRLYEKIDSLFQVQQMLNGDSHGESPEEAVAGGMDPNAAMAMGQEGQPAFQIGGEYPSPEYHASIGNMWMNTPYPKKDEFQIGGAIAEGLLGGLSTGLRTFGSGYGAGYSLTEDYYGNKNPLAGAAAITSGLSPMANDMGDTMNEWGQLKQEKDVASQNMKVGNVKNAVNPGMAQSTPPVNYQPPGEGMEYLTEDELLTFSKGGRLKNTLADLQAYAGFGLRPKMCNGGKAKIGR